MVEKSRRGAPSADYDRVLRVVGVVLSEQPHQFFRVSLGYGRNVAFGTNDLDRDICTDQMRVDRQTPNMTNVK